MSDYRRQVLDEILNRFKEEILEALADSHTKGMLWQERFSHEAMNRALRVEPGVGRGDMLVAGKVVQCKSVDQITGDNCVAIDNMRPVKANGNERGYLVGEYDVMALQHRGHTYLIPAASLVRGQKLASRVRLQEVAQFRDNWEVFDAGYLPPEPPQKTLWSDCDTSEREAVA